jgi:hypothetical protein
MCWTSNHQKYLLKIPKDTFPFHPPDDGGGWATAHTRKRAGEPLRGRLGRTGHWLGGPRGGGVHGPCGGESGWAARGRGEGGGVGCGWVARQAGPSGGRSEVEFFLFSYFPIFRFHSSFLLNACFTKAKQTHTKNV